MDRDPEVAHREAIAASWERCAHRHNLVAGLARPILRLRSEEIAHRREAFNDMTSGELRGMSQLAALASETASALVVTDRDQILLDIYCRDADREAFESRGVAPGSNWDERIAGTNGVSMASLGRRAVTVRGSEHFYQTLRPFACTAVPVFDAGDAVIALLNFTTIDRGNTADFAFARHVLNMAADRVQAWLFLRRFGAAVTLRVSPPSDASPGRSNALVALDDDGRIVAITAAARAVLPEPEREAALCGRSFEEIFGTRLEPADRVPDRLLSLSPGAGPPAGSVRISAAGLAAARPRAAGRAPQALTGAPAFLALAESGLLPPVRLHQARRLLRAGTPVLIRGPVGSGKSHAARVLLAEAGRAPGIPGVLDIRSEAETVIAARIDGWNRDAAGMPDLMLAESLAAWPPRLQTALLACLERAGAAGHRPALVATCASADTGLLPELGHFLGGFVLDLPPVRQLDSRERLIRHLLRTLVPEGPPALGVEAMAAIAAHDWPGNIRELRGALDVACACCDGGMIARADLPEHVAGRIGAPAETGTPPDLAEVLRLCDWNVTRAAKVTGLSRATLNRRIREQDLHRPGKAARRPVH
ncbi:sigma-54-dependent Fis family transcriptional regulator [Paenirhodobacter hankyongi]|uniref:Sigma-54-dependent Fis family transcriptional regulator n=1 Tax=Paenirhodobacter hankyongi TaxID=2294033 RepID=A0A421BKN1_9RHOB|nr:helix-turn-helix domain-containing protein [Sinirhodobacter hankyongi]RLL62967.1 sigma-54-dependent Fis family transcriptional regulator [Sinirhodobacter hankyongi]